MQNSREMLSGIEAIGFEIRVTAEDVRARSRQLRAEMAEQLMRAEPERQRLMQNLEVARAWLRGLEGRGAER
jgi:hypothetical protein